MSQDRRGWHSETGKGANEVELGGHFHQNVAASREGEAVGLFYLLDMGNWTCERVVHHIG